jgi:uncharacterized membrane protein
MMAARKARAPDRDSGSDRPYRRPPDVPACASTSGADRLRRFVHPFRTLIGLPVRARFRKLLSDMAETFWLLPAAIVAVAIALALGLVSLDKSGLVPDWLVHSPWLYSGGATGARTLLGAVAASTIGVAGTVFSITIAALSLAAGQMGPRLLRNFTRDRGNQFTLGAFLGTFSYALMVLRSVRTQNEGSFTPHVSLTVAILLAFLCVGTLVFFVGHMAGRISVETVIDLVSRDMQTSMRRLTENGTNEPPPPPAFWRAGVAILSDQSGYLQELDAEGLADWAAAHGTALHLLPLVGSYVYPGAAIAIATVPAEGAAKAVRNATALGPVQTASGNPAFTVAQLVEVAVRALSPGINDPNTAKAVLDRLGSALCALAPRHLPTGVFLRGGQVALVVPVVDYALLTDAMFGLIRQNATGSPAVLKHIVDVLTAVAGCERDRIRAAALRRHACLALADAVRKVGNADDLEDIRRSFATFEIVRRDGALAAFHARAQC